MVTEIAPLPDEAANGTPFDKVRHIARTASMWLTIGLLAWAPFPLGGAINWAPGVQEILTVVCWTLWLVSVLGRGEEAWSNLRAIAVPLVLAFLTLMWALMQIRPGAAPPSWVHPVWAMASDVLGTPLQGVVSLNPWRTEGELLKLLSYVMMCWLAFRLGRRTGSAHVLLNAIIFIGAAYAFYAFALIIFGYTQTELFYGLPGDTRYLSGAFMLHNSFATFAGLATLAAIARLISMGAESIVPDRGFRQLVLTIIQFCFSRGISLLLAALLCFAGVVASASRAGFASTMCGITAMALTSLLIRRRGATHAWAGAGALVAMLPIFILIAINGDTLGDRIVQLLDTGTADNIRLALWAAAHRMITDAPWYGLGLGTFQDAYPLYAVQILPFVMDKAHCDYLEFAAGVGLPAAIAWWTAIVWLVLVCVRGVRVRRRNQIFPLIAVGASALVGVHSSVDFSLQLPAVALLYATLLGLGVAQALPTRRGA